MDVLEELKIKSNNCTIPGWASRAGDEIERLRAALAEFQVVAYRREWDGDDSDLGSWIYAEADERDHVGIWEPVYAKVPNAELCGAEGVAHERRVKPL